MTWPPRSGGPGDSKLPYGLTWDDLIPCLPGVDPSKVHAARAFESHLKQGRFQGSGNSCIRTLRYPAAHGVASATVFIKANAPEQREADAYRFLASHGIPVSQLLASVERRGQEILVLEFLPRIGIDPTSRAEVDELLRVLARLNAIAVEPGSHEAPPGRPEAEMDAARRAGLDRLALDPRARVNPGQWLQAYRRASEATRAMPPALTHGEFALQQAGWSAHGELVIFDLATLGTRPRFADLAFLAEVAADGCHSELELIGIYLDELGRMNGTRMDAGTALRELRWFRIENRVNALHWLTHQVYSPGDDALVQVALRLRADMAELGLVGA